MSTGPAKRRSCWPPDSGQRQIDRKFPQQRHVFRWLAERQVVADNLRQRTKLMIFGAHVIVYSRDATADRAFLRDILGFASVDAGHGWLIFALPPAEVAVHPAESNDRHELYFMCDDLRAEIQTLGEKGIQCSEVQEARWGSVTKIRLPGGSEVGLYQPKHPSAFVRITN